jgi:hypothetical protein
MVPSEVESTLSTAHSTNFIDRVERDIAFRRDYREIESQATPATPDTTKLQPRVYKERGVEYIEVLLQPDGQRALRAWYWDQGTEWECQREVNKKKPRVWVCSHCSTSAFKHYSVHGSNKINDHLFKVHRLKKDGLSKSQASIASQLQRHTPQTLPPMSNLDRRQIQKTKFKAALVAFICCCHVAFRIVESQWFVALLSTLSNLVDELLPDSRTTARRWAIDSYHTYKGKIKARLHKAQSNIHLSFNL